MQIYDSALKQEDNTRLESCKVAIQELIDGGLPTWTGFSDESRVVCIRGGTGQVHVGDVFRSVFPSLSYLKSKGIKVVVASTPGLEKIFSEWKDTIKVLDGGKAAAELADDFRAEGVTSYIKWPEYLPIWKQECSTMFNNKARPALDTGPLSVPVALANDLREQYSEGGKKKVVGIIWRTSMIGRDPNRNCSLDEFMPIISHDRSEWNVVSLQYGSLDLIRNELAAFNGGKHDIIFDPSIDPMRDYMSAGAQMVACDHIISIDCSQIFQAGAHGVPVNVLLSEVRKHDHWTAFDAKKNGTCPFFPETGHVFTQETQGDWTSPLRKAHAHAVDAIRNRGSWGHRAAHKIKSLGFLPDFEFAQ